MANNSTNISIRMDSDLKAQAEALFSELGMNLSTAFNIFVRQSLREGRIPFDISLSRPNQKTASAILETDRAAKDKSTDISAKELAFERLEQMRRPMPQLDYDKELQEYREKE